MLKIIIAVSTFILVVSLNVEYPDSIIGLISLLIGSALIAFIFAGAQ